MVASLFGRLQSFRSQPADLWIAHMAGGDDSATLVGAAPRRWDSIDKFRWGRTALSFAGVSVAEFERLAKKLGVDAAAEFLLLIIASKCTSKCSTDECQSQQDRDLGIPWLEKRWQYLQSLDWVIVFTTGNKRLIFPKYDKEEQ